MMKLRNGNDRGMKEATKLLNYSRNTEDFLSTLELFFFHQHAMMKGDSIDEIS